MTRSTWPRVFRNVNSHTPKLEPITPPTSSMTPILTSTLPRLKCASTPEMEDATIWLASVPTATAGGMPMKISSGVIKNPPPTPNRPDKKPTPPPMPKIKKMLTETSAMGR